MCWWVLTNPLITWGLLTTSVEANLTNMFKVLDCLVGEYTIEGRPIGYTALKRCTGMNSRYIYSALRRGVAMGFVKYLERRRGGSWRLYAPTVGGVIADYSYNLALEYGVPELYGLVMEYVVASLRVAVEVFRRWGVLMGRVGVDYNRNYVEALTRTIEHVLNALGEGAPASPEVVKSLRTFLDTVARGWFEEGVIAHLRRAGVPVEVVLGRRAGDTRNLSTEASQGHHA